jgi:hypothetical protein
MIRLKKVIFKKFDDIFVYSGHVPYVVEVRKSISPPLFSFYCFRLNYFKRMKKQIGGDLIADVISYGCYSRYN